jgi:hypothetical protein
MKIKFRPHHFLCAVGFQGKGYSSDFVANFSQIMKILNGPDGDKVAIEVTDVTDSICAPCPHKRNKLCTTQEKIQTLDNNHAQVLKIADGDILTWGEAKQRVIENMNLEKFHQACSSCSWKSSGICEQALNKLRDNNNKD